MYDIGTNKNNENLYILTDVKTNSIKPYIYIGTWEKVIKKFELCTEESDNDSYFSQLIHKVINKPSAEASMRCNHRGWGYDYFRYITIELLAIDY